MRGRLSLPEPAWRRNEQRFHFSFIIVYYWPHEGLLQNLSNIHMEPNLELTSEQLQYLKTQVPSFIQAVAHAKETATAVAVSLADFPAGDMFLLYAALIYSAGESVAVTFLPNPGEPQPA